MTAFNKFLAGVKIFVSVFVTALALTILPFGEMYVVAYYFLRGTMLTPIFMIAHMFFATILSGIVANWWFQYK